MAVQRVAYPPRNSSLTITFGVIPLDPDVISTPPCKNLTYPNVVGAVTSYYIKLAKVI